MVGGVVAFLVTVLLLVGLGLGLVVVRDIAREARERWRSNGRERADDDAGGTGAESDTAGRTVCGHCGTENDPAFTYCRECSQRL